MSIGTEEREDKDPGAREEEEVHVCFVRRSELSTQLTHLRTTRDR